MWDVKGPGRPPARPQCSTSAELPIVVVCLCGAMHVGRGTSSRCPSKFASLHTNGRAPIVDVGLLVSHLRGGGGDEGRCERHDSLALLSRDMASFCVPIETASKKRNARKG